MVFTKKIPALKPYTFDPAAYDLIVIGAPVWASTPAPPIQAFISQASLSGKKIALFVCHAGNKGDALDKFRALLSGTEIIGEADFARTLKNSIEVKQQVADWVKGLG